MAAPTTRQPVRLGWTEAPQEWFSRETREPDNYRVETRRERVHALRFWGIQAGLTLLVALVAVAARGDAPLAAAAAAAAVGVGAVAWGLRPIVTLRVGVTPHGVRVERRSLGRRSDVVLPRRDVAGVSVDEVVVVEAVLRRQRQWRVAAATREGALVSLVLMPSRERAERAAAHVRRVLDAPVPRAPPSAAAPEEVPPPTLPTAPAGFREEGGAAAVEFLDLRVHPVLHFIVAVARDPMVLTRGVAFAGFGLIGLAASVAMAASGNLVGAAVFAVFGLVATIFGAVKAWTGVAAVVGREYARVTTTVIEEGFRVLGRRWGRWAHPISEVAGFEAGEAWRRVVLFGRNEDPDNFGVRLRTTSGKTEPFGFARLTRSEASWLARALDAAVAWARAHPAASGAPVGWPRHPRVWVEEAPNRVRVAGRGVAGAHVAHVLVFALVVLGVGSIIGPLGTYDLARDDTVPLLVVPFAAFFFAMGYVSVAFAVWLAAKAIRNVSRAPVVHEFSAEGVAFGSGRRAERVPLDRVRDVAVRDLAVVLVTDSGDVPLDLVRLTDAEDVEWARDAVEHAIRRFGGAPRESRPASVAA